jgi:hypothetical protein
MGGRGGAGGTAIGKIRRNVESSDWWQSTKQYTKTPEKLLNSPTFMESVKDAIGKEAFMRDYEITTKQVNSLAEKMVRELHGKVKTAEKKTESAEEYAKRYFREHYNPNRGQREITSSTYERAQRRLNENVDSYFGRGMEKRRRKRK